MLGLLSKPWTGEYKFQNHETKWTLELLGNHSLFPYSRGRENHALGPLTSIQVPPSNLVEQALNNASHHGAGLWMAEADDRTLCSGKHHSLGCNYIRSAGTDDSVTGMQSFPNPATSTQPFFWPRVLSKGRLLKNPHILYYGCQM